MKGQANDTPQTWHHVSASNGLLSINGTALLTIIDQKILAAGTNGGQSDGKISQEDREMILNMIEGKMDTVLALIESKLSNVPGQADYCCKCCVGCKCPCCDHVILDILNLQALTLETLEYKGIKLAAANDNGHLVFSTQFPDWKPISMAESASTEIKAKGVAEELMTGKQFSDINTHVTQILNELGAATYHEIILTIPQSAFNAGSYACNLNNTGTLKTVALVHPQLILENF